MKVGYYCWIFPSDWMSGPWGKKSAGARIEIGSPDFFVICNHTRPAPVISGQPHHSTRHIFQGHFFGVAFPRKTKKSIFGGPESWGFSLVFLVSETYTIPPPAKMNEKNPPLQKESFNPTPHRKNFQRELFIILVGGWNIFFFKKSPNHWTSNSQRLNTSIRIFQLRNSTFLGLWPPSQPPNLNNCPPPPTFGDRGAVRTFRSAKKNAGVETWKSTHGVVLWLVCVFMVSWLRGVGCRCLWCSLWFLFWGCLCSQPIWWLSLCQEH